MNDILLKKTEVDIFCENALFSNGKYQFRLIQ
jgi:hypothetical protein